jgi:hypothetical protein
MAMPTRGLTELTWTRIRVNNSGKHIVNTSTFGAKFVLASEAVYQLLKELSFVQCLLLELFVFAIVYMIGTGSAALTAALPLWALALGLAGFAMIMFSTFRMGYAKFGLIALVACLSMMLGIGAASITTSDADARSFGMLSLNDLVVACAWFMTLSGFFGGLGSSLAYVKWARNRRAPSTPGH